MCKIRDIYDMNLNRFIPWDALVNKFGRYISIIQYHQLIASIPNLWKIIIRQLVLGENLAQGPRQLPPGMKLSKYVYWKTLPFQKINSEESTKRVWEHELNIQLTEKELEQIQIILFKRVESTKLRFFQYRHIHKRINTNIQLAKWKPDRTNKCTFCHVYRETTKHLFWKCRKVTVIWNTSCKWLKRKFQTNVEITYQEMIFCTYSGVHRDSVNTIILLFKQHIYTCRCFQKVPTFMSVMCVTQEYSKIEKQVAFLRKKMGKHGGRFCKILYSCIIVITVFIFVVITTHKFKVIC